MDGHSTEADSGNENGNKINIAMNLCVECVNSSIRLFAVCRHSQIGSVDFIAIATATTAIPAYFIHYTVDIGIAFGCILTYAAITNIITIAFAHRTTDCVVVVTRSMNIAYDRVLKAAEILKNYFQFDSKRMATLTSKQDTSCS